MPPKNPMTQEEKRWLVRQEGRIGYLLIDRSLIADMGAKKVNSLLDTMEFQPYKEFDQEFSMGWKLFGYCPLFEPKAEGIPTYILKVDLSENEPIIEVFKQGR